MGVPKTFVADTHALVWFFTEDPRLGTASRDVLRKASQGRKIIVPVIVLAELLHLSRRCRVPLSFSETIARLEAHNGFEIAPLTDSIVKIAAQLPDLLEMHDALIIATSLHYDATLITKDKIILQTATVRTLW
jgi:PIN domain nuclease of toxin-antitoxin system